MQYKIWTKKLNERLLEDNMKQLCSHYMNCLNNIRNKARTHEEDSVLQDDIKFVTAFSNVFEQLNIGDQNFINNKFFFQGKEESGVDKEFLFAKFATMVRLEYETT